MGKASEIWKEIKPKVGEMLMAVNDIETQAEKAQEEAYQRGLNDIWEVVRKISSMDSNTRDEVFGLVITSNIFDENTASEAIEKIRQYEQEKKEKIIKGDVVRIKSAPEVEILVTYADEDYISGIAMTEVDDNCEIGDQYTDIVIQKVEKAGRHYEIAEVLAKMKEEQP